MKHTFCTAPKHPFPHFPHALPSRDDTMFTTKLLTRAAAAALFLGLSWFAFQTPAFTQTPAAPELTISKVAEDLYEIEGDGGNVAVLVTPEGVILVDDKYERDHDQIAAKIRSVTTLPVKYIFTTHYHSDHSGGNAKYLPTADVISTVNARNGILGHKQSNEQPGMAPARLVFNKEMSVFLGGKEVRALHLGRGHTDGDALIYFPGLKTLHTGDLMANTSPLIDYNGGGSVVEWTKTLDEALKLDIDRVIPGHGKVTDKMGLLAYRNTVETLRNQVTAQIRAGKTQPQIAQFMTDQYKWAPQSLNQLWSVPGMMNELK